MQAQRSYITILLSLFLLMALSVYSLMNGAISFSLVQVMQFFVDKASHIQDIILADIRIPRTITAIIAGAALGVAGLLLQTVSRNSLACPSILGISQGSALTALCLLLWLPGISLSVYFVFTILGGIISFTLIYVFAKTKRPSIARLILVGTSFNALFYGISYLLLVTFPARAQSLLFILNGSIAGVHGKQALYLSIISILCIGLAWLFRHRLKLLAASTDTLKSLGDTSQKTALLFILLAVILTASTVGIIGPVFFFGLVIPHIAKLIIGKNSPHLIIVSALIGSIFMLTTDIVIRHFLHGFEISIGIIFAFLSAPFLIFLLKVSRL